MKYDSKGIRPEYRTVDGKPHPLIAYLVKMAPVVGMNEVTIANSAEWFWRLLFHASLNKEVRGVPAHAEIVKMAGLGIDTPELERADFIDKETDSLRLRINGMVMTQINPTGFVGDTVRHGGWDKIEIERNLVILDSFSSLPAAEPLPHTATTHEWPEPEIGDEWTTPSPPTPPTKAPLSPPESGETDFPVEPPPQEPDWNPEAEVWTHPPDPELLEGSSEP